jgi:hypothetical protein
MAAGVDGLLRDKTRPSRIPPLGSEVAERVVALTQSEPPGEATHWTGAVQGAPHWSRVPLPVSESGPLDAAIIDRRSIEGRTPPSIRLRLEIAYQSVKSRGEDVDRIANDEC